MEDRVIRPEPAASKSDLAEVKFNYAINQLGESCWKFVVLMGNSAPLGSVRKIA